MDGGSLRSAPPFNFCPWSLNHEQQLHIASVARGFFAGDSGVEAPANPFFSVNPLPPAKNAQTDELDLPQHLRLNDLSGESDFPPNPGSVVDIELAEAIELQGESICVQMFEQCGFQAADHHADYVLSLFLGTQG